MLNSLKNLFGMGPKTDYSELVKNGAVIVDVRTQQEFKNGHIKGAKNIPVGSLAQNLGKIKNKNTPVITCCASGMRSASAKSILQGRGYTDVYNGGAWTSLQNKL